MRIGRAILALLIALSVAMLPAGAGVTQSPEPADMSATDMSATDMSATDMSDMDCCPHKASPCDKAIDCCTMAACALKCFNFAGTSSSTIVFPSSFANLAIPFGGGPPPSQTGSPPFRPPRA
jgi:uncharacterized protein involved in copper resistance